MVSVALAGLYALTHHLDWVSSATLHTVIESIAMLLALIVGAMALVRYYSAPDNKYLIIGSGFIGTGLLDGYHTVVTSTYFQTFMPSDMPSLIPWSWVASRLFLAIILYVSWWIWKWESSHPAEKKLIRPYTVYTWVGMSTVLCFLFFMLVELPVAYYSHWLLHRPEELIPGLFFLLALTGYISKGEWKRSSFEHWLVLCLLINAIGEVLVMPNSAKLFDAEFDMAHFLKDISYICALIGLLTSMFHSFKKLEIEMGQNARNMINLRKQNDFQVAIADILKVSLMPSSLKEQMQQILSLILDIRWLALKKKGCIFIRCKESDSLKMMASSNLNESLLEMCNQVAFGTCLCGRAAQTQQPIFKSCIDSEHEYAPAGMQPHGHYVYPIVMEGKTLGALNLYVRDGHISSANEQIFLEVVSEILAGIIERKNLEESLSQMSFEDELTKLPNRRYLHDRMLHALASAHRSGRKVGIMCLDLDHFKAVNDSHGHDAGDFVLKKVSARILACLRSIDTLARIGGDEFVILLEELADTKAAKDIAQRIVAEVAKPITIHGHEIRIGASIGMSFYPDDGRAHEDLIKNADLALYGAKQSRGMVISFDAMNEI